MAYDKVALAEECRSMILILHPEATLDLWTDDPGQPGCLIVSCWYVDLHNGCWWRFKGSTISRCWQNTADPWIDMAYVLNLLDDDTIRRISVKVGIPTGGQHGGLCIQM